MGILQVFTLLGALGMFLYGMNLMSSGLQKAAGDRLRGFLSAMTSNPFKGVLTGLGITTVIQSSSATTVMVVSFVNAGLLTLAQAIGVIMGANIGTTVTDQAGTQHSTTIWVDCIMNGHPKVTEFLKAGNQVAVVGTTTLRTYSSEKQRAIVAGAQIRVDSVQLLGGSSDDVPRRLYDDHGAMHDVHKAYYSDVNGCVLQSQRGDRFSVDQNGWITKQTPAPGTGAAPATNDQSQQNADGSPSQIY